MGTTKTLWPSCNQFKWPV